jgi:2,4-dienoyl-CoA reductase-like NADH-dependent reductase (Old Yellow Enzyme family)
MTTPLIAPLLEPMQIRGTKFRNRIAMSPVARAGCQDGVPGEELAAYYRKRAECGVGTIFTGSVFVNHKETADGYGVGVGKTPSLSTTAALEAWRRIVDSVHAAGSLIIPQLLHVGVMKAPSGQPDDIAFSPSGTWGPTDRPTGYTKEAIAALSGRQIHAMTEAEILEIIEAFADSARNAKAVGFDGIALHGAHSYLIDSFLWGGTNLRKDRWGGDHVGRTRFAAELVRAIRAAIGKDMLISIRFSQWKPQDFDARLARSPKELEEILRPLVDASVDILDASSRDFSEPAFDDRPENLPYWTRKVMGMPTMMVGGTAVLRQKFDAPLAPPQTINNLEEIMRRYEHGEFDLLAVGRALLNDPQWLERAREGGPFLPFNPKCLSLAYVT